MTDEKSVKFLLLLIFFAILNFGMFAINIRNATKVKPIHQEGIRNLWYIKKPFVFHPLHQAVKVHGSLKGWLSIRMESLDSQNKIKSVLNDYMIIIDDKFMDEIIGVKNSKPENIARHMFEYCDTRINNENTSIQSICIKDSKGNEVIYHE